MNPKDFPHAAMRAEARILAVRSIRHQSLLLATVLDAVV